LQLCAHEAVQPAAMELRLSTADDPRKDTDIFTGAFASTAASTTTVDSIIAKGIMAHTTAMVRLGRGNPKVWQVWP